MTILYLPIWKSNGISEYCCLLFKLSLHDAGAKQELPHEAQRWIQELKDGVYDADNFLDEFVTLAEQKQLIAETVSTYLFGVVRMCWGASCAL